jgi:acyl-CoA synthetase (AMP-forming)/AMP-acid ligase II/alkylation response protein AidB-like acyl-CoA dehydrogenase/acyl carrier protein
MNAYGSFIALLNDRALNFPNKEIFYYLDDGINVGSKLTYSELLKQSRKVSSLIKQNKKNNSEKVLLLLPQDLNFIVAFLGTIYCGCIPVTAYPPKNNRNLGRIITIIKDSTSSIILTTSKIKEEILSDASLKDLLKTKAIVTLDTDLESAAVDMSPAYTETMFIQYTSGSTGHPKGVVLTHENVLANLEMIKLGMKLDDKSSFYSWLPFFHDMGLIGCILTPIYVNCPSYLTSPSVFIRNPKTWLQGISKFKNTISGAPNFAFDHTYKKFNEIENIDLSSLKVLFNGAEPVRKKTVTKFIEKFSKYGLNKRAIFPCYGMAEATLYVSGAHFNEETTSPEKLEIVNSGYCAEGMDILVCEAGSNTVLAEGKEGEILIGGENVTKGYLGDKDKDRFVAIEGKNYFRTGDLGFLLNSEFYITGRIKDLIIVNGVNYYPDDIEKELTDSFQELSIGSCAAIGLQGNASEKLIIVAEIERTFLKSDMVALCSKINSLIFQNFEIKADQIIFLKPGGIAKTSSGKLQRSAIKQMVLENKLEHIYQWPLQTDGGNIEEASPVLVLEAKSKFDLSEVLSWLDQYFKNRINLVLLNEKRTITPDIVLDFASKGILGMIVPKQYGGLGLSYKEIFKIVEKMAYHDISLALFVGLNNILGIFPILEFGTTETKNSVLPKMANGMALGAFAITEVSAGSNPRNIEATAKKSDGKWILNGQKIWVGSGAWSKYINAYFKEYDENNNYTGITAFLLDTKDFSISFGPEDLTMGVRPMIQTTVIFNNTIATEKNLLSSPGNGLAASYKTMNVARAGLVSIAVGALKRSLEIAEEYASKRIINTGLLSENGFTSIEIMQIKSRLDILTALQNFISRELDNNNNEISEIYSIVAKITGPEFLWSSLDRIMQILGGRGYIEDNVIASLYRDARLLRIFEGPTETLEYHLGSFLFAANWENSPNFKNLHLPVDVIKNLLVEFEANSSTEPQKQHLAKVYVGRILSMEIMKTIAPDSDSHKFLNKEIEKAKIEFKFSSSLLDRKNSTVTPNIKPTDIQASNVKPLLKKDSPSGEEEIEKLKKIFFEVSMGKIKIQNKNENILNYGLDSIMAIEASVKIEEVFGVSFPEHVLWDVNTLEKIFQYIARTEPDPIFQNGKVSLTTQ